MCRIFVRVYRVRWSGPWLKPRQACVNRRRLALLARCCRRGCIEYQCACGSSRSKRLQNCIGSRQDNLPRSWARVCRAVVCLRDQVRHRGARLVAQGRCRAGRRWSHAVQEIREACSTQTRWWPVTCVRAEEDADVCTREG